jgi:hypothetical protein
MSSQNSKRNCSLSFILVDRRVPGLRLQRKKNVSRKHLENGLRREEKEEKEEEEEEGFIRKHAFNK